MVCGDKKGFGDVGVWKSGEHGKLGKQLAAGSLVFFGSISIAVVRLDSGVDAFCTDLE